MSLPLQGLLVIALEQAVAAPYCSSRLADAGARVIKIEREQGDFARAYDHVADGESAYFVWLNRGKESICLDIKNPRDHDMLQRMLSVADVFIQNLAPGAASRAGFDSQQLRDANPRLITVDISGYGDEGPYSEMKAYDLLVQCETGLASITGAAQEPGRVGVSVCDIACGMNAHAAVLQALLERQQTGRGVGLAVSLFDAMADWMTVPLLHRDYGGQAPQRVGLHHPSIAPYGAYVCGDGDQVVISIQNNREWQNFCEQVLEQSELVHAPNYVNNVARCANRAALDAAINCVFGRYDRPRLVAKLLQAGIAFGAVNSVDDLSRHQQLRRSTVATPSGNVELVAPPVLQAGEKVTLRAVPALNEHGAALRLEFAEENSGGGTAC